LEKYLTIIRTDKSYKISEGDEFVSYDLECKEYRISEFAIEYLYDKFGEIFGMLPLSKQECRKIFSLREQSEELSCRGKIRESILGYFLDYDSWRDSLILSVGIDMVPRIVLGKVRYIGQNRYIRGHGLDIYGDEADGDIIEVVKNVLVELEERIPISAATDGIFGKILGTFFFTFTVPNFITMYTAGPIEMTVSVRATTTKVTTTDISSGAKSFEIDLTNDKDFNVITATEEYMTKDGDLIVWKGVRCSDESPGIVELIVARHARIMHNTEGLKFRTNACRVANIYKVNIYECYNCKNCGVYDYEGTLYCTGCAALVVKRLKEQKVEFKMHLIDITKSERRDIAFSREGFRYHMDQDIKIADFKIEPSNCDKVGIYFFFRLEQVFNYMFKPTIKQAEKLEVKGAAASAVGDETRTNGLRLRKLIASSDLEESTPLLDPSPRVKREKGKCVIQ